MANLAPQKKKVPHPIDVHVGSRLRLRRLLTGMSQDKLGEALGLTFQQIQKYEKGMNRIGASRLFEISKILAVPIQFFYDDYEGDGMIGFAEGADDQKKPEKMNIMDILSTPEGLQLCQSFIRINDPKIRKQVLSLVKTLSEDT